ncbi:Nif3-like dinuclear metal center hexameric protein [Paenibacillus sp. MWE-103]|uniref:GTP cyclohydrolase 1 type 2 homolog n=1 Tax=Paenibacillus artemisiicola TaxID=1172618 RepID=A0ABS3WBP2_9BACL|nr:Nif3-like dinuclear metal center hexameric protein [Paenibacillus artemisiicola]MBO7745728.1 Nif3-like dinuclear metal center hexameric protein [Paenibacillus artemisiicola]
MSTVQDILNKLTEPVEPLASTVDGLEFGDASTVVTGIVTAFMATQEVLEQALAVGANLIIAHEGTFYSHQNKGVPWRENPVYRRKQALIQESGIAIYRFHDYLHRYQPDGIMIGLLQELGWTSYKIEHRPSASIVTIPTNTVREVAKWVKRKLDIPYVRVVGDISMPCSQIGLLAGYRGGGTLSIPLFEEANLDLVIAGEGPEWETPEYVRDAVHQRRRKALILLGHAYSEEPGMKHLAKRIKDGFPGVPVRFISGKHVFQVV